jgi:hypothetical protein
MKKSGMTHHPLQMPRPPVTVFLRPSFTITTRDGALDVAVRAQPVQLPPALALAAPRPALA